MSIRKSRIDPPEVFVNKSPAMVSFLAVMAPSGKDPRQGFCALCGKEVDPTTDFKDDCSRKEWTISGMCQDCQDKLFAPEEEDPLAPEEGWEDQGDQV